MKHKIVLCLLGLTVFALSGVAEGKVPDVLRTRFEKRFTPAIEHRGLRTAYEKPDPSKLRGYVVVLQAGIPAEKARWYISWTKYDYRPVRIKGSAISTRLGKVYTYLKRGDVMAISFIKYTSRYIYLGLLSPDIYVPEGVKDGKFSRVTTMVGFHFPKDVIKDAKLDVIFNTIQKWLKPFSNREDAEAFARTIRFRQVQPATVPQTSDSGYYKTDLYPASDVVPTLRRGMHASEVVEVVGQPIEKAIIDSKELWRYPDKIIELRNGKVTDIVYK